MTDEPILDLKTLSSLMQYETEDAMLDRIRGELELACTKDEILSLACCSNSDKRFVVHVTHDHLIPSYGDTGYMSTIEEIRQKRWTNQTLQMDKIRIESVYLEDDGYYNRAASYTYARVEYGRLTSHPDN